MESQPLAGGFGGETERKDLLLIIGVNPDAVV